MLKRVALIAVCLLGLTALPARGDGNPDCKGFGHGGYGCDDNSGGGNHGNGNGGGGTPVNGYYYIVLTAGPASCWYIGFQADPTFVRDQNSWTYAQAVQIAQNDFAGYPNCSSPGAVAAQVWQDQKPVPAQHPALQPDNTAVTGKRAYLLMNGGQTLQTTFPNPLGPSPSISAHVTYDIDWGDGSVHTNTAKPGQAWPGGADEITHVYDVKGAKTITVNAIWNGTWTDPNGGGGNLPALTIPYTFNVNVGEIQAVRNR